MKIDLLQFVPQTISGYKVFVEEKIVGNEQWLRIWYKQNRVRPIEIKRFVEPGSFGRFLGQLQAEGTKDALHKLRVEFCNKNIAEHKEFVIHLQELGIGKRLIVGQLSCKVGFDGTAVAKGYEQLTGISVRYFTKSRQKGKFGFRTYVRSTILTALMLNALDVIRKHLATEQWSETDKELVDTFFAKLLTGDGTLDIRIKNREYDFPYARIKVVDRNKQYLKEYADIMSKLGFKPHIVSKRIFVRAGCSLNNLLYLYKIRAFENSINWAKLLVAIGMYMQGRRHRTNCRFGELPHADTFMSQELAKKHGLGSRAANNWLNNKEKEGLVKAIRRPPYAVQWKVTEKAIELSTILRQWQTELDELKAKSNESRLPELLESLKVRSNQPKSAPIQGQLALSEQA